MKQKTLRLIALLVLNLVVIGGVYMTNPERMEQFVHAYWMELILTFAVANLWQLVDVVWDYARGIWN